MNQTKSLAFGEGLSKSANRTNMWLWVAQGLLVLLFAMASVQKTFFPIEQLSKSMPWVVAFPVPMVRFIGISELLGVIGLILPGLLKFKPELTKYAAMGLVAVMLLASGFHIAKGEFYALPLTGILCMLSAYVAYGRWKLAPFK